MASSAGFLSKDDYKKKKELEEARKTGDAPAEVDQDTGQEINPHIPQFIAQAPWYLDKGQPSLKHQRLRAEEQKPVRQWYRRGERRSVAATKYRLGACTNCGALTHKAKDCCERPRKVGAQYTGMNIQPDEIVEEIELDFEGKRDRWNGYDPAMHIRVIEEYNKAEEHRQLIKAKKLEESVKEDDQKKGSDVEDEVDDDRIAENLNVGTKVDTKTRTTIRNLRIREDTAKYLRNLDVNSAFYDPKTRSMRENPNKDVDASDLSFAGDNFTRFTGDAVKFGDVSRFAWEAYERGSDIHIQAAPSQAELMHKEFNVKQGELQQKRKSDILLKYGGEEHLEKPPVEILLGQTENYVVYSRDGKVVRGQEKLTPKSRYEEDVYINNHTSVWGSYWDSGKWGFACCHSLLKNSYCLGTAGQRAAEETKQEMMARMEGGTQAGEGEREFLKPTTTKRALEKQKTEEKERDERFHKALKKEMERAMAPTKLDERKLKYNSLRDSTEVTDEDMEAYYLMRGRSEDPMKNYADEQGKERAT